MTGLFSMPPYKTSHTTPLIFRSYFENSTYKYFNIFLCRKRNLSMINLNKTINALAILIVASLPFAVKAQTNSTDGKEWTLKSC
jgi:hypothetical protein